MYQRLIGFLAFTLMTGLCVLNSCTGSDDPEQITEVPFTDVHLTDLFWAPKIETNRTVSIPTAFHQCEINGRFDNFALAAGLIEGEHQGDFPFDDTDPYKIIEGASYSLAAHYDPVLDRYLDSVINLIAAAQEPDGYLTTCVTNKSQRLSAWWGSSKWEKINSHELYNSGHLYEAAVAHYQATGKKTLLDVAIKNADLICHVFGPEENQKHVPSGHPIVEMALCKLYRVTGEQKYLDLAKYFVEETGRGTDGHHLSEYSQDHMPILQQEEIVGHAVRAGYLYSGVIDVASLTEDSEYLTAVKRIWENMAGKKLYITGGIGSRPMGEGFGPEYELHSMENYCETCASIANVYWNYRMFLATGDPKYVDVYERAMYNGVISGVSLSGDRFFYDNPLESMGQHERQEWFGCACCPGNVTRFMASVPGYFYAVCGNDIYINMYAEGSSEVSTAANKIEIIQETEYPWNGRISIKLKPEQEQRFALKIRIPGWVKDNPVGTDLYSYSDQAKSCTLTVNGKKISSRQQGGYITVNRKWSENDIIELEFPMDVRRVRANEKVSADIGKLAIERGPVVYCLEGKDQADSTVFDRYIPENAAFNYRFVEDKLGGIVELTGTAVEVSKEDSQNEVSFTAIPYYTWCNRGSDDMIVWIPESAERVNSTPGPTLASQATALNLLDRNRIQHEYTNGFADGLYGSDTRGIPVWGINDQRDPSSSSDIGTPYHCWWYNRKKEENVAYLFDEATEVSNVEVYWLDFDHYDLNYRVPQSWKLYYRNGKGNWLEVEKEGDYGIEKDMYNRVSFEPVKTDGLKIVAIPQKDASGGILEWKVNS